MEGGNLGRRDTARAVGLSDGEFDAAVERGTITPGRFDRLCRADVEALAGVVRTRHSGVPVLAGVTRSER
jgi:hypothetical protein